MELTPSQLDILQHSLGVDEYGRGKHYRNHFVTGEGSKDYNDCCQLVESGLMQNRGSSQLTGGDDCFVVTDRGKMVMDEQSPELPEPPKVSRGASRYQQYLRGEYNETFGEFLKYRWYRCAEDNN